MDQESDGPIDLSRIRGFAQREVNVSYSITPEMMLAYRRCQRECWLRYHDQLTQDDGADSSGRNEEKKDLPPLDIALDLVDGGRASLLENRLCVSRNNLLRTYVSICSLPSGTASVMVLNRDLSHEECRLRLAFDSYVLMDQNISCEVGLIRNENGTLCETVEITDYMINEMIRLVNGVFRLIKKQVQPVIKDASAVCDRCALAERCLPDEANILCGYDHLSEQLQRRLFAERDDREPFYVTSQGSAISLTGNELVVTTREEEQQSKPITEIRNLVLFGNIQMTTQALNRLCEKGVAVIYRSMSGLLYGIATGPKFGVHNAVSLKGQILYASDPVRSADIAVEMISSKIHNQRVLIMRNLRGLVSDDYLAHALRRLQRLSHSVLGCHDAQKILGMEGEAAAIYFSCFEKYVSACENDFKVSDRNRRPPQDPVNCMLSFGYALLETDITVAVLSEGLNQWIGFLHTQRSGKPALVVDLMEEFRPIIIDSIVIGVVSRNLLSTDDFDLIREKDDSTPCCRFKPDARKKFINLYENKLSQLVTHPHFNYRVSWRKVISLQVRILCKVLRGELERYRGMEIR